MMKWFRRTERNNGKDRVEDRRAFFKAGAGAVAGGAAMMVGSAAKAGPISPTEAGYRETDHVKRYYDSARM